MVVCPGAARWRQGYHGETGQRQQGGATGQDGHNSQGNYNHVTMID